MNPAHVFNPERNCTRFKELIPKLSAYIHNSICVYQSNKRKKKIHERSDHPFGTNNLLVLQMWYRFERKLALGIPFCMRPEPTAVRAAPTSAYVVHLNLQMQRQNKWMKNCHWMGGLWNFALEMKEKYKTVEQQKNPSFRGSSHIYSPTVPSSRIRVPKHCLSAKAFDA